MQTAIMKNETRLVVFNEEARQRLSVANEAIRRIRVRGGLLRINEVHLDSHYPLILLGCMPPELLLDAASGLHSRKTTGDDGRYVVRCTAFGCDWSWLSTVPAVHVSRQIERLREPLPQALPKNVHPLFEHPSQANPMLGGHVLSTLGEAR